MIFGRSTISSSRWIFRPDDIVHLTSCSRPTPIVTDVLPAGTDAKAPPVAETRTTRAALLTMWNVSRVLTAFTNV